MEGEGGEERGREKAQTAACRAGGRQRRTDVGPRRQVPLGQLLAEDFRVLLGDPVDGQGNHDGNDKIRTDRRSPAELRMAAVTIVP